MQLNKTEREMLSGKQGPGIQKCMQLLVAMGEINDAKRMIPLVSGHMAGKYNIMGEEGVSWVEELVRGGARIRVYTTKNPEIFDFENPDELGVPQKYRDQQYRIDHVLRELGVTLTYSCHHYLVGNVPRFGDHIAWASSGSLVYANSVIGARSNREADHVVIAAGVTGVIPEWGLHLAENRKGEVLINTKNLNLSQLNLADYQAMGWKLGKVLGGKIPVFVDLPPDLSIQVIKALLYSVTVTGSMALAHLVGITPEAPTLEAACGGNGSSLPVVTISNEDIKQAYQEISTAKSDKVDLVIFGCPQCAIQEITEIVQILDDKKVAPGVEFWICTSNWVKNLAKRMGYYEKIKAAGGRIVADIGAADGPHVYLRERGIKTLAINSARGSYYAHNGYGMDTWFGTTRECIETALTGTWQGQKG
jgi:predicted aconitase